MKSDTHSMFGTCTVQRAMEKPSRIIWCQTLRKPCANLAHTLRGEPQGVSYGQGLPIPVYRGGCKTQYRV